MKFLVPILALGAFLVATGANAKPMGHNSNIVLTPPAVTFPAPLPTVNSGALGALPQQTIGTPLANQGAFSSVMVPTITPQLSGALPGEPGSPTYDPNAALPSLGNAGSALAPDPATSAAGFNTPSINPGTNPFAGTGG